MDPVTTASEIAPVVDRLRMAMMQASIAAGFPAAAGELGLDQGTVTMLAYLRNAWPDRVVERAWVRAVFTYQPEKPVDDALDALAAAGVVSEPRAGAVLLSPLGRDLLTEMHLTAGAAADALWAGALDHVAVAGPLAGRVLEAARATGGAAFTLMAHHGLPDGLSAAGVLAEHLTGLRFHRFDAHVAAWRAAGYDVADLDGLDAASRDEVEEETNQRAGRPYAVLTAAERAALLDHLAALPC